LLRALVVVRIRDVTREFFPEGPETEPREEVGPVDGRVEVVFRLETVREGRTEELNWGGGVFDMAVDDKGS
jgi:hypothetical protein